MKQHGNFSDKSKTKNQTRRFALHPSQKLWQKDVQLPPDYISKPLVSTTEELSPPPAPFVEAFLISHILEQSSSPVCFCQSLLLCWNSASGNTKCKNTSTLLKHIALICCVNEENILSIVEMSSSIKM